MELRIARQIARLTQKQLAEFAGVDDSTISLVENGHRDIRSMSYAAVVRIAHALNVEAHELWPVDVTTGRPLPSTESEDVTR